MAVTGMTTVLSNSAITEKIVETMDRSAENRQLATNTVVQQQAEERVKTVQQVNKTELVQAVRSKRDEEKERRRKKRQQEENKKNNRPGGNLDLQA